MQHEKEAFERKVEMMVADFKEAAIAKSEAKEAESDSSRSADYNSCSPCHSLSPSNDNCYRKTAAATTTGKTKRLKTSATKYYRGE